MAERRAEEPGERTGAVPRDLPDQQAGAAADDEPALPQAEEPDERLPDTDEAGTGRRGAPRPASPHPDQPVPDEPTD